MNTQVRLISMTKPIAEELKDFTAEELTAYVARVSNPANQMNSATAPKLLGYCIKNAHWSVFEHISFTVEIKTSRAIAAQILRHRSAVFQEFSQRYAEAIDNEFYDARRQDLKNRQNSIDDMSEEDKQWFKEAQEKVWGTSLSLYKEALGRGVAKELSRMLLPLSTQTTLYMTNNLRNWLHYVELRADPATQLEHRVIAEAIKEIIKTHFPAISEAKKWIGETQPLNIT
jgi:thymidylate synthase (FAD)